MTTSQTKSITKSKNDTQGVVVTYIPRLESDPVQSNKDSYFYFRNGDEFTKLPYAMLKRLFASAESPDLRLVFDDRYITLTEEGCWKISAPIRNDSSAAAEHVVVLFEIKSPSDCLVKKYRMTRDESYFNPGRRVYSNMLPHVIHKGLVTNAGEFHIEMNNKKVLELGITIFANRMRARQWEMTIKYTKKGFIVEKIQEGYLY